MNDSEFRDWTRGQLHSFDVRMKTAIAEMKAGAARHAIEGQVSGDVEKLAENLRRQAADKQIAGLAIAFVTVDGTVLSGFSAGPGTYFQLAGAANFVGLEVLEGYRQWAAEEAREEAKNGQDGGS